MFHGILVPVPEAGRQLYQLVVHFPVETVLLGQNAVEILPGHSGGTADQIAQVVGQVLIDGLNQQLIGEIPVGAEGEGPQQEEAQGVHPVPLGQ